MAAAEEEALYLVVVSVVAEIEMLVAVFPGPHKTIVLVVVALAMVEIELLVAVFPSPRTRIAMVVVVVVDVVVAAESFDEKVET